MAILSPRMSTPLKSHNFYRFYSKLLIINDKAYRNGDYLLKLDEIV